MYFSPSILDDASLWESGVVADILEPPRLLFGCKVSALLLSPEPIVLVAPALFYFETGVAVTLSLWSKMFFWVSRLTCKGETASSLITCYVASNSISRLERYFCTLCIIADVLIL